MFSRRAGHRFNRGRVGGSGVVAPPNLLAEQSFGVEIVASKLDPLLAEQTFTVDITATEGGFDPLAWKSVLDAAAVSYNFYLQADAGIIETSPGSGVLSSWNDQSASNNDGTAVGSPPYSATGGPDGHGVVSGDGTAAAVSTPINPPAPGTTPTWFYAVLRLNAWASAANIIGADGANFRLACNTASSPQTVVANTTSSSVLNMTIATWFRARWYFANSANGTTGDHYDLGANTSGRGTAFGNQNPTGLRLFSRTGGSNFCNASIALIISGQGAEPAQSVFDDLDAVTASQYPSVSI